MVNSETYIKYEIENFSPFFMKVRGIEYRKGNHLKLNNRKIINIEKLYLGENDNYFIIMKRDRKSYFTVKRGNLCEY